jgi:hypothetical protein
VSPNPDAYDPGPGQPFGLGNRQDKDGGDQIDRSIPTGVKEQPRSTPNAADTPEEPAEVD